MLKKARRKYNLMIEEMESLQSLQIKQFMNRLNNGFKQGSTFKEARESFQNIATVIYQRHQLKHLPIYFSLRKYKITTAGEIFYDRKTQTPKTIVIFILRALYYLDFNDQDITGKQIYFPEFEKAIGTLAHEIAHLKEIQKNGNSTHNYRFKETYRNIQNEILGL